jgi:predicted RNase H-like HicB family nuclease
VKCPSWLDSNRDHAREALHRAERPSPGVITTGAPRKKTHKLIPEAIEFHPEGLKQDNLPIPEPAASAEVDSNPLPNRKRLCCELVFVLVTAAGFGFPFDSARRGVRTRGARETS